MFELLIGKGQRFFPLMVSQFYDQFLTVLQLAPQLLGLELKTLRIMPIDFFLIFNSFLHGVVFLRKFLYFFQIGATFIGAANGVDVIGVKDKLVGLLVFSLSFIFDLHKIFFQISVLDVEFIVL